MNSSRWLTFSAFAALTAIVAPGLQSNGGGLVASGGSYSIGLDTDGDGLHDALEARLNTSWATADSDSDGMDDFEEMNLGTNPIVPDQVGSVTPSARLYADLYAIDDELVFQFAAFHSTSVEHVRFVAAGPSGSRIVPLDRLIPYISSSYVRNTSFTGWGIQAASFRLPSSLVLSGRSQSYALIAMVDGVEMGYEIMLNVLDGLNVQVRNDLINFSSGGGGVFPIEPGAQAPSAAVDQVCVQTLAVGGNDGNGTIFYVVQEASCEELAAAICLPGCTGTELTTQVGIDILTWIN